MWWAITSLSIPSALGLAGIALFARHRRPAPSTFEAFCAIRTVQQEVRFLQALEAGRSTEDLAEILTNLVRNEAPRISSEHVQRLSRLHQRYSKDLGIYGYASQFVWASVVAACSEEQLVFS